MISSGAPRCYSASSLLRLYSTHWAFFKREALLRKEGDPAALELRSPVGSQGRVPCSDLTGGLCQGAPAAWLLMLGSGNNLCYNLSSIQQAGKGCDGSTYRQIQQPQYPAQLRQRGYKKTQLLHNVGSLTAGEMNSILKWASVRKWISRIASLSSRYIGFWAE